MPGEGGPGAQGAGREAEGTGRRTGGALGVSVFPGGTVTLSSNGRYLLDQPTDQAVPDREGRRAGGMLPPRGPDAERPEEAQEVWRRHADHRLRHLPGRSGATHGPRWLLRSQLFLSSVPEIAGPSKLRLRAGQRPSPERPPPTAEPGLGRTPGQGLLQAPRLPGQKQDVHQPEGSLPPLPAAPGRVRPGSQHF